MSDWRVSGVSGVFKVIEVIEECSISLIRSIGIGY